MKRNPLKAILAEIKYVRSARDVRILAEKFPYAYRRITGRYAHDSKVPPSLQIEPTNACNAVCLSCPREDILRRKGYMELPLFKKIIDDAARCGVRRVHLYLLGEPLLHPHIVEMIGYLKRAGLSVNLTTNGMLLSRKLGEAILKCGLDHGDYFMFSILGNSASVHEEIMKGVLHDTVVENLAGFMEARKAMNLNGPIVEAIFYTMKENEAEAPLFEREWRHRVDRAFVAAKISESFAGSKAHEVRVPVRTRTCSQLWERMTVYWTGEVVSCTVDINARHVVGNLNHQSIEEVWNSDGLSSMRKLHREGKFSELDLCATCDF
jgi:radical SAM protein with 4Fe4S-binding SPASM domain